MTGNSLLPYCHFDLHESDYISNRRPSDTKAGINLLNSRTAGGIDPATKVIEFSAIGTGQNIIRCGLRYFILQLNHPILQSIQLSIHPFIHLSIHPLVHPSIRPCNHPISPSIEPSIHLPIHLFIHPFIH